MAQQIDLRGQRFGRLVAVEPVAGTRSEKRRWLVKCDCGGESVVVTDKLRSGRTQSCGCIKFETTRTNGTKNRVHGRGHGKSDPTYRTWLSMRERCRSRYPDKANYWARGISVCERWNSFEAFLEDMGERPLGATLDRVDVNGNYEPGNCRWATAKEQQRNRRNTNYLLHAGGKRPAMDVADELGVSKAAMQYFVTVSRRMVSHYGTVLNPEGCLSMDSDGS